MKRVYIAVGSNIEPEKNVKLAVRFLSCTLDVTGVSTVYRTKAEKGRSDPDYYNCVLEVSTDLEPHRLKYAVLRPIEIALGRKRTSDRYASRTIDLDLVLYDGEVLKDEALTLPDPDVTDRPYLAIPLRELAPDLQIPGAGAIAEVASRLDGSAMKPLPDYTLALRREILHGRKEDRYRQDRRADQPAPR